MRAHAGPVLLGMFILSTPSPVMLSALSLLSSFPFLLVVPVFSISLSRHRFLLLDRCFLRRDCWARFTTDPALADMVQAKET